MLALAVPLAWAAVRFFHRRERDRLRPILAPGRAPAPCSSPPVSAVVPLGLGSALLGQVDRGFQGGAR